MAATTTVLGFLTVACMVNTDAYTADVLSRLAFIIIASSILAGILGATITLIVRRWQ